MRNLTFTKPTRVWTVRVAQESSSSQLAGSRGRVANDGLIGASDTRKERRGRGVDIGVALPSDDRMLSQDELLSWYQQRNVSNDARLEVNRVRSSGPSRRVGGGRSNVSGRYPSRKMGVTIQFESHRVELAFVREMEHDPDVIELCAGQSYVGASPNGIGDGSDRWGGHHIIEWRYSNLQNHNMEVRIVQPNILQSLYPTPSRRRPPLPTTSALPEALR